MLAVASVDLFLCTFWAQGLLQGWQVVLMHSAIVTLAMLVLIAFDGENRGSIAGTAALLLVLGPLGGPALMISRALGRVFGPIETIPDRTLASDQVAAEEIFLAIRQGRRHNPATGAPANLGEVLSSPNRAAHTDAIASIARQFRPEMRSALDAALTSRDAALRVQAAAVFAKLRTSFADRATEVLLALDEAPLGAAAGKLAAEARAVALSGFVEEDMKRNLLAAATVLDGRRSATPSVPARTRPTALREWQRLSSTRRRALAE